METKEGKIYIRIRSVKNPKYWYAKLIGRVIIAYRELAVSGDWRVSYKGLSSEDYELMNVTPRHSDNCLGQVKEYDAVVVTEKEYLDCQQNATLTYCIHKLTKELNS